MHEAFLSCDWGTSALRVRLVRTASGEIIAEADSDQGVAAVRERIAAGDEDPDRVFARTLAGAVELVVAPSPATRPLPIVVSGMASANIGWCELPYATTPLALRGDALPRARLSLASSRGTHDVLLVSGLRTEDDALRGEETETIGLLADPANAALRAKCLVLLPGTHSKHLIVRDERIDGFRTYLTGELFDLLAQKSLLRHSVDPVLEPCGDPRQEAAFRGGVLHATREPLLGLLFRVRTNQLFGRLDPRQNAAFLSGLLIGSELADLRAEAYAGFPLLLGGSARLAPLYHAALGELGLSSRVVSAGAAASARAVARAHALYLEAATRQDQAAPGTFGSRP